MAIDAGTVYYTVDSKTEQAISGIDKVKDSVDATGKSLKTLDTNVTKTATAVNSGMSRIGRSAGQAGIQIQQFIGQIQGGQSAMLALSQQSADLGFVLGAPLLGAVVGIGASIAGMLLPNLFKTTDALEDVEKATENVKAAITLSSEGVVGYSEKMKVLANVSESLARIKLANIIADQSAAMQTASKGINDTLDEFRGLNFETELFGKRSEQATRIFIELSEVARNFEADPQGSIERFESSLKAAEEAGINTTESGRKLVRVITDLVAQYKLGELTISQLKEQLDGTKLSFDDVGESGTKYDNLLKRLTIRSNETKTAQLEQEKALVMLEKGFKELEPEKQKAIADAYDLVIANTREAESEKALAKSKRETAAAERESRKASKAFIKNFGIEGDEFGESPDSEATEISRSVIDQYNPEKTLEKLQRQRDLIEQFRDWEIGSAEEHTEALKALDREIAEERLNNNKLVSGSLDALESAGTNAIAGILSGTMSASDAMRNLANSILNNAVGALVEMGIQYVKNQIIEKASAASSVATAATTGTAIASAYAPAAAAASIATLGGAAASGLSAMAASIPAMIGMIAGGRLNGGPVSSGKMYRINENGAPEIFNSSNGQQFMLPNTRGEVISNAKARKPAYPSVATSNPTNQSQQNTSPINLSVEIVNQIEDAQFQTQMTEEGVRIIATRVFNENIDKGVSGVLGKKGTKANKTMTSKYDTRNKY